MVFVIVRDKKQNISNARKTLRKFTKLSVKPEIDGRYSEYKGFAVETKARLKIDITSVG
jgi:hypothetical protein